MGVVVVGTGFGCRVHVPAARAAGLGVVALVGRDRERTARRAARAEVAVACGSLEEALALPHSDIVVVSTSPGTHADLAEEAIAAGRHVLVEKPFTLTAAEARRLVDAAGRAGVVGLVGHEFRFVPQRVTFRQALVDGLVGTPRLATFVGHLSLVASVDARRAHVVVRPCAGRWLARRVGLAPRRRDSLLARRVRVRERGVADGVRPRFVDAGRGQRVDPVPHAVGV